MEKTLSSLNKTSLLIREESKANAAKNSHTNDEISKRLAKDKSLSFIGTVWISEDMVTNDWTPDLNRKLDMKKVKTMVSAWGKADNAHLFRLKAEHSLLLTIAEAEVPQLLSNLEGDFDAQTLVGVCLGPNNASGSVCTFLPTFAESLKKSDSKLLRIEAGQHRLRAIQELTVAHHHGMWPAQVFVRERFDTLMLKALRFNATTFTLANNDSDTLYTLAPVFRDYSARGYKDKKLAKEIRSRLLACSDKLNSFFNKAVGRVWMQIIGYYPNAGLGLTGNRISTLNGSYFQDVSCVLRES